MEAARAFSRPIRVLIADDQRSFVEALAAILSSEDDIEIVGVANDGRQAVELAAELDPSVILMDISMPVLDGIEATRLIRQRDPDACVLVLTGSNARSDIDRARRAGAAAYLTKDRIGAELIPAIVELASR
jgi:DNA-binding NarL/FixJ family response regulator